MAQRPLFSIKKLLALLAVRTVGWASPKLFEPFKAANTQTIPRQKDSVSVNGALKSVLALYLKGLDLNQAKPKDSTGRKGGRED